MVWNFELFICVGFALAFQNGGKISIIFQNCEIGLLDYIRMVGFGF
jgi:hypothetical protein